ncbi:MAG: tetratricopeptide repeat protein [Proteobacteria bacterium]|nr:tetratricopeptide repeat protein [Pseudomonadota bacterium]
MPRNRPISTLTAVVAALALSGCATLSSPPARSGAYEDLDPDVVALFLEAQMAQAEPVPETGDDTRAARAAALLQEAVAREPESAFLRRYLAEAWASQREITKAIAAGEAALRLDPTDARTHYILGMQYLQSSQPEVAEGHFREAARRGIGGDTPWKPHQLLFGLLRTQGRVEDALTALTAWMEALPGHPEPATLRASYLWGVGRLDEGVEAAIAALQVDPGSERATDILATWYRYDPAGEAASLERVLASNWSNERLHRRLVDVYDQMGRYDKAIGHLRYVGMLDGGAEGDLVRRRARLLRESHRHTEAAALLRARVDAAGGQPESRDLLALAAAEQALGDLEGALTTLRRVAPEEPEYPAAARARVRVHAQAERPRDAVEAAVAARQLVPADRPRQQASLLVEAAHASIDAGAVDEAERLIGEVMKLDPSAGGLLRIQLLRERGEHEEAAELVRTKLALEVDNLNLVASLSDLLAEVGDYEGASATLDEAIAGVEARRDEQTADVVVRAQVWELQADAGNEIAWLLLRRSFVEKEAGSLDASQATLEAVLEQWPNHADALNSLGYLLAEENRDLDRAAELLTRALEQRPFSAAFQDSMGWVRYRQGRFAEAVEHLEQAAAWQPGEPEIDGHLEEARRALKQAG